MFFLFILDIIIYISIVLILHIILKKNLDTGNTSVESFTKNENKTKHTTDTNKDVANNNASETEEDTASWDEVHVSKQPVNTEQPEQPEQPVEQPSFSILDDRTLFNHSNSSRLQGQDTWTGNDPSELLQNKFSNSLDEQYAPLYKDLDSIKITKQSYDNVISLRSKEFDSYFSQNNETTSGAEQPNKPMLDINNNIGNHLNVQKINPEHSSNVLADEAPFSSNTLNYKSLDNTTIFNKNTPIVEQYNTVKEFTDGEQFLKKEQVDNMDDVTIQDNRERKLKKEGIRLSDVRNTYAISNNNLIGDKNKTANQLQAYEDSGNLATI